MSAQKQPCRKINLYSRPAQIPFEEFRKTLLDLTMAVKDVPIAQQNFLRMELAFVQSDWSSTVHSLNLAPNITASFEAILIVDVESLEQYEEVMRNPEVIKLKEAAKYTIVFDCVEYIFTQETITIMERK